MSTNILLKEIEAEFPFVERPPTSNLVFHSGCGGCADLIDDLEGLTGSSISVEGIRAIHQSLPHLSAEGWRWMLPSYLRYAITPEAEYNRMEVEFLVYSLRPRLNFQADTAKRLSLLAPGQIRCLIDFLKCCRSNKFWKEYFPEDIEEATNYLSSLLAARSRRSDS
jgi:hypothetical protein